MVFENAFNITGEKIFYKHYISFTLKKKCAFGENMIFYREKYHFLTISRHIFIAIIPTVTS